MVPVVTISGGSPVVVAIGPLTSGGLLESGQLSGTFDADILVDIGTSSDRFGGNFTSFSTAPWYLGGLTVGPVNIDLYFPLWHRVGDNRYLCLKLDPLSANSSSRGIFMATYRPPGK